jgi:hypothetical protein
MIGATVFVLGSGVRTLRRKRCWIRAILDKSPVPRERVPTDLAPTLK